LNHSNGLAPGLLPRDPAGDDNSGSPEPNLLLRLGLNSRQDKPKETLPTGAPRPTIKRSATHVDALTDASRDAGAIPAASINSHLRFVVSGYFYWCCVACLFARDAGSNPPPTINHSSLRFIISNWTRST